MDTGSEDPEADRRPAMPPPRRHRKGDTAAMIAALARGATQEEAAAAAGLSTREVRRRMREPAIKRKLASARRDHHRQMMALIAEAGYEAITTLRELQQAGQPAETRLKSATELYRGAVRNLDSLVTREDLDDLQAQLDELRTSDGTDLDP